MCVCVCVWPTVVDIFSKLADGFGVSQIQQPGNYVGSLHLPHDVTGSLLPLRHVSARQNHPGTYRPPDNSLVNEAAYVQIHLSYVCKCGLPQLHSQNSFFWWVFFSKDFLPLAHWVIHFAKHYSQKASSRLLCVILASGGQIFHRLFAYSSIPSCHYSSLPVQAHIRVPFVEKQRPGRGKIWMYQNNL